MKTVYLHIGHYKTGTTAFQSYCADNAAGLARRGLLYPKTGRLACAPTSHAGLSIPLAADHGFRPPRWFASDAAATPTFEALHDEIAQTPQRKALISSEEFIQFALRSDPEAALHDLRAHLDRYRVRVIFMVREPLALLQSWFAQVSRGAVQPKTFLDFAAGLSPDFLSQDPIRARFAEAFGAGNMRVLRYRGVGPWMKRRMLWSTGTVPYSRVTRPVANVTPSLEHLETQRLTKNKAEASGKPGLTQASLSDLEATLDRVNRDYRRLASHLRVTPSALSLCTVVEHYRNLIEPAARHVPLDPREAEAMRMFAGAAREAEVADIFRQIATLIDASQSHRATPEATWA